MIRYISLSRILKHSSSVKKIIIHSSDFQSHSQNYNETAHFTSLHRLAINYQNKGFLKASTTRTSDSWYILQQSPVDCTILTLIIHKHFAYFCIVPCCWLFIYNICYVSLANLNSSASSQSHAHSLINWLNSTYFLLEMCDKSISTFVVQSDPTPHQGP